MRLLSSGRTGTETKADHCKNCSRQDVPDLLLASDVAPEDGGLQAGEVPFKM